MVKLPNGRAQLGFGQEVEGQETRESFLDVVNNGLFDEGPDPIGFDPKGAANPGDVLAQLAFRKGPLEIKSCPYKHHHRRY